MQKLFYPMLLIMVVIFVTPVLYTNAQIIKEISKQKYQNGDIIFQTSNSRQCEAVKLATHSTISHCGLLFYNDNQWKVLEALEPVQVVSLSTWIARGEGEHYTVKRLKKEFNTLNESKLARIENIGKAWLGKHYDLQFNWSNDQLYCSELVWKLYNEGAGIDLCPLKSLKDFDLGSKLVQDMLHERYGTKIPLNELVVAPADIFNAEKLEKVEEQ